MELSQCAKPVLLASFFAGFKRWALVPISNLLPTKALGKVTFGRLSRELEMQRQCESAVLWKMSKHFLSGALYIPISFQKLGSL